MDTYYLNRVGEKYQIWIFFCYVNCYDNGKSEIYQNLQFRLVRNQRISYQVWCNTENVRYDCDKEDFLSTSGVLMRKASYVELKVGRK